MSSFLLPRPLVTAILETNPMDVPTCSLRDIDSAPHPMSATRLTLSIVLVGGLLGLFTAPACCAENEKAPQREIGSPTTPGTKPARPHLVGRYAHAGLIVFEGNQIYFSALLRRGLLASTNFLLAAYPAEEFDTHRDIPSPLILGYDHQGSSDLSSRKHAAW